MQKYLSLLVFLSSVCIAQNDKYDYTLTTTVLSQYYGSIIGGIFYDRPLVFSDLNVARNDQKGSSYVNFWFARPITHKQYNVDGGDEYDLTVGRILLLGKTGSVPKAILNLSGTYLAIHPLGHFNGHVWTAQGRVDFPSVPVVQPYVQYYHFGTTGVTSPPAGEFVYAGVTRNQKTRFAIGDRKISVAIDYRFGFSGGALGTDIGPSYNRMSVGLVLPITEKISIIPTAIGQVPFKRHDPLKVLGDHSRGFYTLSVVYKIGKI